MSEARDSARRDFFEGTRTERCPFVVNDTVEVTDGKYRGRFAAVISVETIDPETTLLIEFGDNGEDAIVPVRILRLDAG